MQNFNQIIISKLWKNSAQNLKFPTILKKQHRHNMRYTKSGLSRILHLVFGYIAQDIITFLKQSLQSLQIDDQP